MKAMVSVYVVFGSADEAERVARTVVSEGLAACANILAPCRSIYCWQGEVKNGQEIPTLFKTAALSADPLVERLAVLHSYEVPAIVVWPVDRAAEGYLDWVCETTIING